jgi:hypothetical protein
MFEPNFGPVGLQIWPPGGHLGIPIFALFSLTTLARIL